MNPTRRESQVPPPWVHNPSRWSQRIPVAILALIGVFIAVYLALFQWGLVEHAWDPVFGEQTEQVLKSPVAQKLFRWIGTHDAALGAFAYLGDAILALVGSTQRWRCRPWMVLLFGLDVIPLGIVSAVLVVLQGTVVGNWCFLCLITAVISLTLILFAYDEVWSCILYLWAVWERSRDPRLLWDTFWGKGSPQAQAAARDFTRKRREKWMQRGKVMDHVGTSG